MKADMGWRPGRAPLGYLNSKREEKGKQYNLNDDTTGAIIIPFGQSDMIDLFMRGIAQENADFFSEYLYAVLTKLTELFIDKHVESGNRVKVSKEVNDVALKVIKEFKNHFMDFQQSKFVSQIINVVGTLPIRGNGSNG